MNDLPGTFAILSAGKTIEWTGYYDAGPRLIITDHDARATITLDFREMQVLQDEINKRYSPL